MKYLRRLTNRQKAIAGLVAIVTLGTAAAAWAYFTSSGTGTGHASVATLAAPTAVTPTPSGPTVSVSWTGVTAPNGGALTGAQQGYYVTRTPSPSGTPSAACASSPTTLLHDLDIPCTDSGVASGNYTYTVTAVFNSFSSTSAPSSVVTVVADSTPPTVSTPGVAASITFGSNPVFVNNEVVNLTDVASDIGPPVQSGVQSVAYYFCVGATGACTSATPWTPIGTSTTAAGNWPFAWTPLPADGPYRIVAVGTDNAGNVSNPSSATLVTVDKTPPNVSRPIVNGNS